MTRRIRSVIRFAAMVGLTAATTLHVGFAASTLNFTGKYVHKGQKGNSDIDPEVTLEVVQKDGAVEITREELGSKTTNRYTLDNAEEDCLAAGDIEGKCKARLRPAAPLPIIMVSYIYCILVRIITKESSWILMVN